MNRYSLWLEPAGEVRDRLSRILHGLCARYEAPSFAPHVTLLGNCLGPRREFLRRSACVAAALRPLVIRLGEVDCRDEYYRCLFAHAALTEPLRRAHQVAARLMGHGGAHGHTPVPATFMPHLSLLYGNFERSIKQELIAEMGGRLDLQFKARRLHLWLTHGDPRQWRRVASFALK